MGKDHRTLHVYLTHCAQLTWRRVGEIGLVAKTSVVYEKVEIGGLSDSRGELCAHLRIREISDEYLVARAVKPGGLAELFRRSDHLL